MSELIRVYTDGSSLKNGKKDCRSGTGIYFIDLDEKISLSSEEASLKCNVELEGHSNNVGELLGILVALVHFEDKSKEMMIHTDSMYCLNSLSLWWQSWANNGWITATGTPVKNKNLIKRILEEKGKFKNIYFKHVRSHRQEPSDRSSDQWRDWYGNDQADKLATASVHINLKK